MTKLCIVDAKDLSYTKFIEHEYVDSENINFIAKGIPKTKFSIVNLFAPLDMEFFFIKNYFLLLIQTTLWGDQLKCGYDKTVKYELKKLKYPFKPSYHGSSGLGSINFFAPTEKLTCIFEYFKFQLDVFGDKSLFFRNPKKYPCNEKAKNELLFAEKFYCDNGFDLFVLNNHFGPTLSYVASEVSRRIRVPMDLREIDESHVQGVALLNELKWPTHYISAVLMLKSLFNNQFLTSSPSKLDYVSQPLEMSKLDLNYPNSRYIKDYVDGLIKYTCDMVDKYKSILFYNGFL